MPLQFALVPSAIKTDEKQTNGTVMKVLLGVLDDLIAD